MAQPQPPTFDPAKMPVTPEQIFALQRELSDLRQIVARSVDAMPNEPFYECLEPFYSPDDVYYPSGARFVDVTGRMIPNEQMIPLNPAAEERMGEFLSTLPHAQRTPTLENIVQSAMKMRPRDGDDPKLFAEFQSRMMREAMEMQYGLAPGAPVPPAKIHPDLPRKRDGIPMMPNTRITGGQAYRGPAQGSTRLTAESVPAALRSTRVMGSVQSNPLGTEQGGVTAR